MSWPTCLTYIFLLICFLKKEQTPAEMVPTRAKAHQGGMVAVVHKKTHLRTKRFSGVWFDFRPQLPGEADKEIKKNQNFGKKDRFFPLNECSSFNNFQSLSSFGFNLKFLYAFSNLIVSLLIQLVWRMYELSLHAMCLIECPYSTEVYTDKIELVVCLLGPALKFEV